MSSAGTESFKLGVLRTSAQENEKYRSPRKANDQRREEVFVEKMEKLVSEVCVRAGPGGVGKL